METNYKISIPKPCHQNWDKMTPDKTGRFCNSCSKNVVDFTGMKANEIQAFFIKHQGQKVCGRFRNEQLDLITIKIPREVLFSQLQFHKMFLLALLICMGTTLFSCQDSNGDKHNIGEVEIVDATEPRATIGIILPEKETSDQPDTSSVKSNRLQTKKSETEINREAAVTSGDIVVEPAPVKPGDPNEIYPASTVEVQPEFPGGLSKFYDYINLNVKIPPEQKGSTGKLIFTFVVDKNGDLSDIKLLRGIRENIDNEVIRALQSSPKWIPGKQNGQEVNVLYSLPVKINASE